jgi:nitrate reductase gamma subunit
MESVKIIVGVLFPYVAVLVFVGGMIYRLSTWKRLASPAMTLFPAPSTQRRNAINTLGEVLLFKSLFNGDRALWYFAWIFHAVLALILLGHLRLLANVDDVVLKPVFRISERGIKAMSAYSGSAAGVVILVTLALLLVRRITLQRVREITGVADYLVLLLLGAVVVTGDVLRFGSEHFDPKLTQDYFAALVTFSLSDLAPVKSALQNDAFFVHFCLVLVLLMSIPFSKILHLGGIFFTHQLIRKQ